MDYESSVERISTSGYDHRGQPIKDPNRVDAFVYEEEITFMRWEKIAMDRRARYARTKDSDRNLVMYPSFYMTERSVGGRSAVDQQDEINSALKKTSAEKSGVALQQTPAASGADPLKGGYTGSVKSAPRLPNAMDIDPNWIIVPTVGLEEVAAEEVAELGKVSSRHKSVTIQSILQMEGKVFVTVPELCTFSDPREPLQFKKTRDSNGRESLVIRSQPICVIREIKEETRDVYTGQRIPAGRHLFISTMALRCFRAKLGLSKFLKAMEYEHTPVTESVVDIALTGHEGLLHVHKSFPKPGKRLNRAGYASAATSVIRALSIENSQTIYNVYAHEMNPHQPPAAGDLRLAKERDQREADFDKPLELDGLDEFLEEAMKTHQATKETFGADPKPRGRKAAAVEPASGEGAARPVFRRKDVPLSAADTSVRPAKVANTCYERYHIYELFENWMKREYNKDAVKGTKKLSDKSYYPGRMTEVIKEQVRMGPQYLATRVVCGAQRVLYPEQLKDDFIKQQSVNVTTRRASSYLGVRVDDAKASRKYLLDQLATHRLSLANEWRDATIGDRPPSTRERAAPAAVGSPGEPAPREARKHGKSSKSGKRKHRDPELMTAPELAMGEESNFSEWDPEEEPPVGEAVAPSVPRGGFLSKGPSTS